MAVLLVLAADLRYVAAPNETFGIAGFLWIAGIGFLLCSAFVGSNSLWGTNNVVTQFFWATLFLFLVARVAIASPI